MGLTLEEIEEELTKIEALITLLRDQPESYDEWRRLVVTYEVKGVQVHDAKIVAAMLVHKIEDLVTFNDKDFKRYRKIRAWTPANMLVVEF